MALAMNTRTGKTVSVPAHYIGHEVLGKDLVAVGENVQAAPKKENKKKSSEYIPTFMKKDADLVDIQIEEQPAPDNIEENEE